MSDCAAARSRWRRVLVLGGLAAAAGNLPGPVRAQADPATPRVARVGWLTLNSSGRYERITSRGFIAGLREAGFVEGQNLSFVRRSAEGRLRTLRALAREIVAAGVDVIFAPAKPMADAAWYASRRIPTVIATVTDPVAVEYAVSLARPGKHITGVTTANAELIGKRLQLLSELLPGLQRIGTVIDPGLLASCVEEVTLMERAAERLGARIVRIEVAADGEAGLAQAVDDAKAAKVQALVSAPMTSNQDMTDRIAQHARRVGLPFVHDVPELAADALATYGPDFEDIFRRAGHYVARILKGETPARMAIEEPRQLRLILNQTVARELGVRLPPAVLARADEVLP